MYGLQLLIPDRPYIGISKQIGNCSLIGPWDGWWPFLSKTLCLDSLATTGDIKPSDRQTHMPRRVSMQDGSDTCNCYQVAGMANMQNPIFGPFKKAFAVTVASKFFIAIYSPTLEGLKSSLCTCLPLAIFRAGHVLFLT